MIRTHKGIKVTVEAVWAGWSYSFSYKGVKHTGDHYSQSHLAYEEARKKIEKSKSTKGNQK